DPHALAELSRDVRPPDYAAEFVRMALRSSELDAPIAVAAVVRPEWLAGVVAEYGVIELPLGQALARYAALD
ncbi:MAG: alpha/beta fold hydrolase, partial [Acidimicrobiales bacterium]